MAITRIKNNQITDSTINAASKLQDFSITSNKLTNNFTYGSDFTITGNLLVSGETTAIDTTNLLVEDPIVVLASAQTGTPTLDIGFIGQRGTEENVAWIWDEDANQFVGAFTSLTDSSTTLVITGYADLQVNNLQAQDANLTGTLSVAGNVEFSGNVANLNVTGNIAGGNISTAGELTATGNITGGNVSTAGQVTATGNITGGNISTAGSTQTGSLSANTTITADGNITGANILTDGVVTATGNITGGNIDTAGAIQTDSLNATTTINANGNISGGNLNTAGTTQTGSLSANSTISANGNITGGNISTTGQVSATGNITGGNVSTAGQVTATGNITGGNLVTAGTTQTDSLNANTTITATGNVSGGNLTTAGTTQTGSLSADTTITATGNITGGNIDTAGQVTATGNITGGNIETAGAIQTGSLSSDTTITATGNITGGNIETAGQVSATGNVSSGNLNTAGTTQTGSLSANTTITATGNVSGGNVSATGEVEAGGNIIGNNITANALLTAANVEIGSATALRIFYSDANGQIRTDSNLTFDTSNVVLNGTLQVDNVTVDNNFITTAANVDLVIDESGSGIFYVDRDTTISGNLSVLGTTTTINSEEKSIVDPIISIGRGANFTALDTDDGKDRGIAMFYFDTDEKVAFMGFDNPTGEWRFFDEAVITDEEVTGQLGTINVGGLTTDSVTVSSNLSAGNISTAGTTQTGSLSANTTITATGNVSGGNISTDGITQTGSLSANTTITATGNISGGNIETAGQVTATGNVSGGNLNTAGITQTGSLSANTTVTATGNITGGNIETAGSVSANTTITATGNITGGNVSTAGVVEATGNITGGNIDTAGQITATGNITGGNIETAGAIQTGSLSANTTIAATGNITGSNLFTAGTTQTGSLSANTTITATGNISGGNISTDGSTQTDSLSANTTITAGGNISGANINTNGVVTANGNITGGNINTAGTTQTGSLSANTTITATGNISGGNLKTSDAVIANTMTANSSVTTPAVNSDAGLAIQSGDNGNITISANGTGSVILSNQTTNQMLWVGPDLEMRTDANAEFDGENFIIIGTAKFDNVLVDNNDITSDNGKLTINAAGDDVDFAVSGNGIANLLYIHASTDQVGIGGDQVINGAVLTVDSTDAMVVPVGTVAERPETPAAGMVRFNTSSAELEFYDGASWNSTGAIFTLIASDTFEGDGSTVAFTLDEDSTTAASIVSINGVVQLPVVSYAVSNDILTFTEAPLSGDQIEVRRLTTTITPSALFNIDGSAQVNTLDTEATVEIRGNLIPDANVTYDLGSDSIRWKDLYLSGDSIILGNIVIKNTGGNSIGFFGADGTTPAILDASAEIVADKIASGSANVKFDGLNGNVLVSAGGNANVGVFDANGLVVTGSIEATNGFIGLDATKIQSGTSEVAVLTENGNIAAIVGGTTRLGVDTQGISVTGTSSATGNVSGSNLTTSGTTQTGSLSANTTITATGNITGGNISTAGEITATDLVLAGNLTVQGAQTVLETATLQVEDQNIELGKVATPTNVTANTGGITILAGTDGDKTWKWLSATSSWTSSEHINVASSKDYKINGNTVLSNNTLGSGVVNSSLTSVGTLTSLAVSGNVTTGNVSGTNGSFTNVSGNGSALTALNANNISSGTLAVARGGTGTTTSTGSGAVVLGTSPTFTTQITVPSIVKSGTNGVGNIGQSNNSFNTVFAKATSAQYADLAEMYVADADYEPGIVVSFGGEHEVTVSQTDGDSKIAGVISTNPSYLMNSVQEGEHVVAVALTGRVPTRVVGKVRKGDMMVSNGDGTARAESNPGIGTVIGKALENFDGESGVIEVVVGRL